jgi:CheY-like chemotaxis protein
MQLFSWKKEQCEPEDSTTCRRSHEKTKFQPSATVRRQPYMGNDHHEPDQIGCAIPGKSKERHEMNEQVTAGSEPWSVDRRRPTILLVDDHPSIRLILSAGLKAHGFDMLTAATAEKAMALCEAFDGPIDILLADVGLTPQDLWPGEGADDSIPHGVALAERALTVRPSLKVILFTGYSDERLKRLGAATERFVLLRKPCGLSTLINTFRELLQHEPKNIECPLAAVDKNELGNSL